MSPTRLSVQAVVTAGVLITGVVLAAIGSGAAAGGPSRHTAAVTGHHLAASAPGVHFRAPSPTSPSTLLDPLLRDALMRGLHHRPSERWAKLLPPAPRSATVLVPPADLSLAAMGKLFPSPTSRHLLRFDGYRRGVHRMYRGATFGVEEELWQFQHPAGAAAWYIAYCHDNQPERNHVFSASFAPNHSGARAFIGSGLDTAGYHFAVVTATWVRGVSATPPRSGGRCGR